jgi:DNA invertase Pin-like site-specific DNA recombinase
MSRKSTRCAIYTRKSSDEGLDQSFNSLDAQREAGEAYIKSQAHEGWKALSKPYDDGGYSGGTMERPGLQLLLADVDAGLIDVVVVYKIDRLTRSLADFARIVERFEANGVSFVSVTQSFNTTSSMGRLTLNVLLSFAQFEREVTGERIRDKIAASKAKGMWMGGNPPLGYDLPAPGTRILRINAAEADAVRHIFARYLDLGSVHALQRELAEQWILSKQRQTASGKTTGGAPFSRGALFHLLRNVIYCGCMAHKSIVYDGAHDAIVDKQLFDRVQEQLDRQARRHSSASDHRVMKAPLTGKVFDAAGAPMCPSFSRGRKRRLYRYYVSASLQQGGNADADAIQRISANALEAIVGQLMSRWLPKLGSPLDIPRSIRVRSDGLLIDMPGDCAADIASKVTCGEAIIHSTRALCRVEVPIALPMRGGKRLIVAGRRTSRPDRVLIAGLRKAHSMVSQNRKLPVVTAAPVSRYERELLRLAFLAPDLQRDILAGHQPPTLTLEQLRHMAIPLCWGEQRKVLGWS